jgi:hypoxanthine phosphoribosyltransferase
MKEKTFVNWENLEKLCQIVSRKIDDSGYIPDILIAIVRGGMVPARIISSELKNPKLYCIKYEYYDENNMPTNEPLLTQTLDISLNGKKILLIDEVADSGNTIQKAIAYLFSLKAKEIKTAVLHYKYSSSFTPDYFVERTDRWIVYPWEEKKE